MGNENSRESQTESTEKKKRHWKRWVAIVLCLFFAVLCLLAWNRLHIPLDGASWIARTQWGEPPQETEEKRSVVLIGHRGMGLEPTAEASQEEYIGNTLTAIQRGFEAADWVEVDVQCSASGENGEQGKLFLFHDKKLSPRTNAAGPEIHKSASECTWEELQKLTLNVSTGDKKIVSLDDAFDKTHQPSRKWIFDVKRWHS